jgi:mono/diheme cytochrome c family protein
MFKSFLVLSASLLFLATAALAADESAGTLHLQVARTNTVDGQQMYASYCASCHGLDGRGNESMAASLKNRPCDLTKLTRNNNGKYPEARVFSAIQFGGQHGHDMPAWGPVMTHMDHSASKGSAYLRMSNLDRYVRSLQQN